MVPASTLHVVLAEAETLTLAVKDRILEAGLCVDVMAANPPIVTDFSLWGYK